MAGFGRHHRLHEDRFFELAGTLAIEVEFIVDEAQAQQLVELVRAEGVRVFCVQVPARFGIINPDDQDDAEAEALE